MTIPVIRVCKGNVDNIVSIIELVEFNELKDYYSFDDLRNIATEWIDANLDIEAVKIFHKQKKDFEHYMEWECQKKIWWLWPDSIRREPFNGTFFEFRFIDID